MNASWAGPSSPRAALISRRTTRLSVIRSTRPFTRRSPPKSLVLNPLSQAHLDPFSVVAIGSSGTALLFKKSYLPAVVPSPTTTVSSLSDHAPIDRCCTAGDGSSRPPHLFKRTSVHDLGLPPSTTPFPCLRIKPIQMSSPPPNTAPPGRFTCSKRLVYTTAGSLPQPRPSLASRSSLFLSPITVDGSSRTATTDPENPDRDRVTSPLATRLTIDHSGRPPSREADSSDPGCSARGTSARDGPELPS
jgi:hypothetical protein